jgi:hypothetical protein
MFTTPAMAAAFSVKARVRPEAYRDILMSMEDQEG